MPRTIPNEKQMSEKKENFIMTPENICGREDLSLGAKVLYGFINSYSKRHSKCWASNPYIANYFSTDVRTISRWIKELKDKKLIDVKSYYKSGRVEKRLMQLLNEETKTFDILDKEIKNNIESLIKKWTENHLEIYRKKPKKPTAVKIMNNIKYLLKRVNIKELLTAIDAAMKDEFCINKGYSLIYILTNIDKYIEVEN